MEKNLVDDTVIVLAGPPGAGKGTLSELLQECLYTNLGIAHTVIETKAFLKERFNSIITSGGLVEDKEVIRIIEKPLREANELIILDGFPRTIGQAKWLKDLDGFRIIVLKVEASYEEIRKRVKDRRVCSVCGKSHNLSNKKFKPKIEGTCNKCGGTLEIRPDDAKIDERLETYQNETVCAVEELIVNGVECHVINSNEFLKDDNYVYVMNLLKDLRLK